MNKPLRVSNSPYAKALRSLRFDFENIRFKKSQAEVAEGSGVSQSVLWSWEQGRGKPNDGQLRKLLATYKVTKKDFDQLVLSMSDSGQPKQGAEANP